MLSRWHNKDTIVLHSLHLGFTCLLYPHMIKICKLVANVIVLWKVCTYISIIDLLRYNQIGYYFIKWTHCHGREQFHVFLELKCRMIQ